jgi:hypothetical protein
VALTVVVAPWTPCGITQELVLPCGEGWPASTGPLSKRGQETPDFLVLEENGEDWLQFGELVSVGLVGTSCVTGDGS